MLCGMYHFYVNLICAFMLHSGLNILSELCFKIWTWIQILEKCSSKESLSEFYFKSANEKGGVHKDAKLGDYLQ